MARSRTRPADIILDMLRGARGTGRSAAYLVETAAVFGVADNVVRVTLSRLQGRGLIESPERGHYRLAKRADPINEFVERWRLGESRIRDWVPAEWLVADARDLTREGLWVLDALGFREARENLFVRPDNLAMSTSDLAIMAQAMGLPTTVWLMSGSSVNEDLALLWQRLWDADSINGTYVDMTAQLEASMQALDSTGADQARKETFELGGTAIHLLAKDPLLPASMVDVARRQKLFETMSRYDQLGKRIWSAGSKASDDVLPVPALQQA